MNLVYQFMEFHGLEVWLAFQGQWYKIHVCAYSVSMYVLYMYVYVCICMYMHIYAYMCV
jgi:hypothetical protein